MRARLAVYIKSLVVEGIAIGLSAKPGTTFFQPAVVAFDSFHGTETFGDLPGTIRINQQLVAGECNTTSD